MNKKIYVGCSLTHATEEFKQQVLGFREELGKTYDILRFVGISPETPAPAVYEHDISCVEASDLLVGVCDETSTGLGMEMGYAIGIGRTVLAVCRNDILLTKMVIGAGESLMAPTAHFARYENLIDDVVPMVHELLQD